MFSLPFRTRRPSVHRDPAARLDPRSGTPIRRGPEPMPRMRWHH